MPDPTLPSAPDPHEVCTDLTCGRSGYHLVVDHQPTGDTPQPYTPGELAAVRPIIEGNRPENPQRRLLATLDLHLARPAAEPVPALLRSIADTATALAEHWTAATADPSSARDVRWTAVALAEQVAALLRGDHRRAVDLADTIAETVDDERSVAELVEAGELAICAMCLDTYEPDEAHTCPTRSGR